MTADFSQLKKLEVTKDATTEYELVELGENAPVLGGVFAGETNKRYQNALIKHANRGARRVRGNRLSGRELKENRDHDRELYPKCVLKFWRNVVDKDGKGVPFSEDDCAAFVDALPDDLFDDVRNHFASAASFRTDDDLGMSEVDMEDLGNSSPPAFSGTSATSETAGQ